MFAELVFFNNWRLWNVAWGVLVSFNFENEIFLKECWVSLLYSTLEKFLSRRLSFYNWHIPLYCCSEFRKQLQVDTYWRTNLYFYLEACTNARLFNIKLFYMPSIWIVSFGLNITGLTEKRVKTWLNYKVCLHYNNSFLRNFELRKSFVLVLRYTTCLISIHKVMDNIEE